MLRVHGNKILVLSKRTYDVTAMMILRLLHFSAPSPPSMFSLGYKCKDCVTDIPSGLGNTMVTYFAVGGLWFYESLAVTKGSTFDVRAVFIYG